MLAARPAFPDPSTPARPSVHDFWRRWLADRAYFRRMCIRWLHGDLHAVEEVLSCGSLRAFEYLQRYPGTVEKFQPWVLQLLRNLCCDTLRLAGRNVSTSVAAAEVPCRAAQPDRNVYRRELRVALTGAVARLPPRLLDVLTMRFVDGLAYDEICRRLAITPDNARKRLQQARARLRKQLVRVA